MEDTIFIVIVITIYILVIGGTAALIARVRNLGKNWFLAGLFFGPLAWLIALFATPESHEANDTKNLQKWFKHLKSGNSYSVFTSFK